MVLESWGDIYKCLQIACTKLITTELMDISEFNIGINGRLYFLVCTEFVEFFCTYKT